MKLQVNFRFSNSGPITMIYLRGLRTVLCLALEVSVLVSVLWQGQGQGTSPQDQDQGQGSKNLPRGSLEPRHCLEAPHHCRLAACFTRIGSMCGVEIYYRSFWHFGNYNYYLRKTVGKKMTKMGQKLIKIAQKSRCFCTFSVFVLLFDSQVCKLNPECLWCWQ